MDQPRANDALEGRDLGDEYLFYDREHDRVHVLNGTAREVFLLCDGSRTVAQLALALVDRYGIDDETARRDTEELVTRLRELGLLAPS